MTDLSSGGLQLCGLTFKEGVASSVLPVAPMDVMLIPDPYMLQVVHRPHERRAREPLSAFSMMTLIPAQVCQGSPVLAERMSAFAFEIIKHWNPQESMQNEAAEGRLKSLLTRMWLR